MLIGSYRSLELAPSYCFQQLRCTSWLDQPKIPKLMLCLQTNPKVLRDQLIRDTLEETPDLSLQRGCSRIH